MRARNLPKWQRLTGQGNCDSIHSLLHGAASDVHVIFVMNSSNLMISCCSYFFSPTTTYTPPCRPHKTSQRTPLTSMAKSTIELRPRTVSAPV